MPAIAERLKRQLAAKGEKNAESKAYAFLNKAGVLKGDKLTPKGEKRQSMGAAGRAKDRAAKSSGGKASDFTYNPKTNRATRDYGDTPAGHEYDKLNNKAERKW